MEKRVHPAKPEAAAQFDAKAAVAANERTEKLQRDALRLLEQLLDALKLDKGMGAGQVVSGGRNGPEADGIPYAAELKVLKALQEEVNRRTEAFHKQHPDAAKLSKVEKAELEALGQDQVEIAELLDKLMTPDDPEGDKP